MIDMSESEYFEVDSITEDFFIKTNEPFIDEEIALGTTVAGWELAGKPFPRLVAGAKTLIKQIDETWPNRKRNFDGWLGNEDHQQISSDHNPDSRGLVHAIDIDHNFGNEEDRRGDAAKNFSNELIAYVRRGVPGSERLKYVVYNNQIASGTYRDRYWTWRKGNFGCTQHIHIAFSNIGEIDGRRFSLPSLGSSYGTSLMEDSENAMPKFPGKEKLVFGQTNESIRRMQNQLISKNYSLPDGATASYDDYTKDAIKKLYHKMGKTGNGKTVGPAAWKFLFKD
jgi:hypothetical protein